MERICRDAYKGKTPHHHHFELRAVRPSGSIDGFIGKLAGRRVRSVALEEMQEAAAAGWSQQR
jgi:hypothetical protein